MLLIDTKTMMHRQILLLKGRVCVVEIPVALIFLLASTVTHGQESGSKGIPLHEVRVVPRVSISETISDNVRLSNVNQQGDQITQVSPGILVTRVEGPLKGYFDYSFNQIAYAQNASPSQHQNALTTYATLEVIENFLSVDVNGVISQQSISAFGPQSTDNSALNANQTEVSNYRISPFVHGRIGSLANYEARFNRAVIQSDAATGSGVASMDGFVKMSGIGGHQRIGWSVDASRQHLDYSAGRSTDDDRLNLSLSYAIGPQFNMAVYGGLERSNFSTVDQESYATSGIQVSWLPSALTRLAASRNNRSFGSEHHLNFEHRTGRTSWRFSDSYDIAATPSQIGSASQGTLYDTLYSQFSTIEPDPAARAQLVNAVLQSNNLKPTTRVISSYLTSAISLQRRQDFAVELNGVRSILTLMVSRSEGRRLDTLSSGVDDFTQSSVVRQHGLSVNFLHRLTPDYSLGFLASQQISSGETSLQDATLHLLNISLTGKIGKRTSTSVGVRRVVSSGNVAPYAESAVTLNLIVQF